jgi:ABC-2 type transport system ATP-binding protein
MTIAVYTQDLTKIYSTGFWKTKKFCALDHLNLTVHENEVFGYLGPNGAGKSTTLKLLMSLTFPTSGKAEILGRPPQASATRKQIGFLPEHPYFYEYLTADEFLRYYAGLFDMPDALIQQRIGYYLHLAGVYEYRKMQLRKYSKGMIQRIGIVQALINDPKVIFLDEPMSGLDPVGRREVRDLILKLKEEGKTVFFSTHILNDVEQLCDRVAILNRGKLIGSGLLKDLISKEIHHVEIVLDGIEEEMLRQVTGSMATPHMTGTTFRLDLDASTPLAPIITKIEEAGGRIISINPIRQTMEDYFFSLLSDSQNSRGISISPA